jgi:hypothetical protein
MFPLVLTGSSSRADQVFGWPWSVKFCEAYRSGWYSRNPLSFMGLWGRDISILTGERCFPIDMVCATSINSTFYGISIILSVLSIQFLRWNARLFESLQESGLRTYGAAHFVREKCSPMWSTSWKVQIPTPSKDRNILRIVIIRNSVILGLFLCEISLFSLIEQETLASPSKIHDSSISYPLMHDLANSSFSQ